MLPKPEKITDGLVVRENTRTHTIELFPIGDPAKVFVFNQCHQFGVSTPHRLFKDGARVLHVHPAYDFNQVVAYFKSYEKEGSSE